MFSIPSWLIALICFLAFLVAVWRSRIDRRANGYLSHGLIILWLGVVYVTLQLNLGGLNDNLQARALAVRLPLLILIGIIAMTDLAAIWQTRRARGRHG